MQGHTTMPLISVTRLRIRSPWFLPAFFWNSLWSILQARCAPGCLAAKTLTDANRTFWTKTAWDGEAAMRAYMRSGAHLRVMPKLRQRCDEASVAHWQQENAVLPDWREGHRRMLEVGRPSKINHPAQAHLAFEIQEPKL
jgi:hypothetical protein